MSTLAPPSPTRFLAVDLHKDYLVISGLDAQLKVVLAPRRLSLDAWPGWARKYLHPTDQLVVESTTNAWDFYDETAPLVDRVVVANAGKIKLIANAQVKTDKVDALKLARLLVAGLIPEVWVPPVAVRELRSLLAHRRRMVKVRTMLRNRLHSLLHRHHLTPPDGDPFLASQQTWWRQLPVSPTEQLHVRHDLATLAQLEPQIVEVELELRRLTTVAPWAEAYTYLVQIPGFGFLTAMTVLAAIGDITRFDSAKKLVGYAGLGARVHDSGQTHRGGAITKSGRRELRTALTEAAWTAANTHPYWKQEFARLERRLGKNKAIVALAHKLLITIWHVLTKQEADRHADPDSVAFKFIMWGGALTREQRGGLTTRQFARYHLLKLQLGHDLTHVVRGGARHLIAPADEVLALRPELRSQPPGQEPPSAD